MSFILKIILQWFSPWSILKINFLSVSCYNHILQKFIILIYIYIILFQIFFNQYHLNFGRVFFWVFDALLLLAFLFKKFPIMVYLNKEQFRLLDLLERVIDFIISFVVSSLISIISCCLSFAFTALYFWILLIRSSMSVEKSEYTCLLKKSWSESCHSL